MRLLITAISLSTPIALAALGEGFSQKSGTFNLSIIAYLSIGAFSSWSVAYYTQNPWLGVISAMITGGLLALTFAFFTVTLKLSQIVVGIGYVFFIEGFLCFLTFNFWPNYLVPTSYSVEVFESAGIPFLKDIPLIGDLLFGYHFIVYFILITAYILSFVVNKTDFGLKIKAVGISALASDTMGISISKVRFLCIIVCGILSGLAGSYITLVRAHSYTSGIAAGIGFIAIATVALGNWNFYKILLASFLFGFIRAIHFRVQATNWIYIPSEIWQMMPYIAAIIALFLVSYKFEMAEPPELAKTYIREDEA